MTCQSINYVHIKVIYKIHIWLEAPSPKNNHMNKELSKSLGTDRALEHSEILAQGPRMNPESNFGPSQDIVSVSSAENSSLGGESKKNFAVKNSLKEVEICPAFKAQSKHLLLDTRVEKRSVLLRSISRTSSPLTKKRNFIQRMLFIPFGRCLRISRRKKLIDNGLKESSLKDILFRQKIIKFVQILRNQASLRDIRKPTGRAISLINDLSHEEKEIELKAFERKRSFPLRQPSVKVFSIGRDL